MSTRARVSVMLVALAGLGVLTVWGVTGLPDFGHYAGPYGTTINHVVTAERQVTNAVAALVFDYRGFDTMGEELILFVSVVGLTTLLREQRGEEPASGSQGVEPVARTSDPLRVLGPLLVGVTLLMGLVIVVHGNLTPGGGFQGGVILGAAVLAAFLAGEVVLVRRLEPTTAMEVLHAAGAAGLVLLAVGGLVEGREIFHNFLYTGTVGLLNSGGTIPLANLAVGLEVLGATLLLSAELLEQTLIVRESGGEGA